MENNNENKQNVNVNEQQAQVENNEKKSSWIGAGWQMIKNTAGAAAGFVKEHKTGTAITLVTVAVSTAALVVLKKKGKVEEPAVDADGFDKK
jgi:molybdopterin-biosynthesis enzyme MoeA-like protein